VNYLCVITNYYCIYHLVITGDLLPLQIIPIEWNALHAFKRSSWRMLLSVGLAWPLILPWTWTATSGLAVYPHYDAMKKIGHV